MKIAVTPADQAVARLDIKLAEQLGEEVDPKVRLIAEADLSIASEEHLPEEVVSNSVFLDDETGEPVAVLKTFRKRGSSRVPAQRSSLVEKATQDS